MSHKVDQHPAPEPPESSQQELALAWLDRKLAEARKAYAPYEAAARMLERARKSRSSKPITVDTPDPGSDSGADREDWRVEKYADAHEEEQAEHLLYDDDPKRDEADRRIDELEHERDWLADYTNGNWDSDYGESDAHAAEQAIENYAALETKQRDSESEGDSLAA